MGKKIITEIWIITPLGIHGHIYFKAGEKGVREIVVDEDHSDTPLVYILFDDKSSQTFYAMPYTYKSKIEEIEV
jgi:aspartyl aminopeptidase